MKTEPGVDDSMENILQFWTRLSSSFGLLAKGDMENWKKKEKEVHGFCMLGSAGQSSWM